MSNLLKQGLSAFILLAIPVATGITGGIIGVIIGNSPKYNGGDFSMPIGFILIGFFGLIVGCLIGVSINFGIFSLQHWVFRKPSIKGLIINGFFMVVLLIACGLMSLILPHS